MAQEMSVTAKFNLKDNMSSKLENIKVTMRQLSEEPKRVTTGFNSLIKGVVGLKGVGMAFEFIKNSVGGAISRFDTLNNSTRTFKNMGFSAQATKRAMDGLNHSIHGLPTTLSEAVGGTQELAGATNDIGKAKDIYSAVNDSVLAMGKGSEESKNAVTQLSQALANGKIDGQTWISLMNSGMGPVLDAMARKMGITTGQLKQGLSSGKISVKQFEDALISLDKNGGGGFVALNKMAHDSVNGIGTAVKNLGSRVINGMVEVVKGLNTAVVNATGKGIGEWINKASAKLSSGFKEMGKSTKKLTPLIHAVFVTVRKLVKFLSSDLGKSLLASVTALTAFSVAVKGVSKGLKAVKTAGSVGKALSTFAKSTKLATTAQTAFNAVMAINPFVLIIGALVAVTAGLVFFFAKTETGRKIWKKFSSSIRKGCHKIGQAFDSVVKGISKAFNGISTFVKVVAKKGAQTIKTAIKSMAKAVKSKVKTIAKPFKQLMKSIKQIVKTGFKVLGKAVEIYLKEWMVIFKRAFAIIKALFTMFINGVKNIWNGLKALGSTVSQIVSSITSFFSGMASTVVSVVSGLVSSVVGFFSGLWGTLTSIVSGIVNSVVNVFSSMVSHVRGIVSRIKGAFSSLSSFSLASAGHAIMSSFLGGLKSAFEHVKSFVSGIAGWIKAHKGPIEYDSVLLVDEGHAIMDGFNRGLMASFEDVKSNVSGMASQIQSQFATEFNKPVNMRLNANTTGTVPFNNTLERKLDELIKVAQNGNNIVLDSGQLVGATVNQYDASLGQKARNERRYRL